MHMHVCPHAILPDEQDVVHFVLPPLRVGTVCVRVGRAVVQAGQETEGVHGDLQKSRDVLSARPGKYRLTVVTPKESAGT